MGISERYVMALGYKGAFGLLLVGGILKKVNAKNPLNVMTNVHWTSLTGCHHQIIAEEPNNLFKFIVACSKQIFKRTQ